MSISSRITAMEGHIGDIYDTLELGGADLTNVNKNIVNIDTQLKDRYLDYLNNGTDEIWNNWEKVTATNVNAATLNNTVQAPIKLELKGNTFQQTYTGKNLYNNNSSTTNYYINNSGNFVIGSDGDTFIETIIENNIAANYVISYSERVGNSYVRFSFFNGDNFISRTLLTNNESYVTVPANTTKIYIHTDKRNTKYFVNLQIEAGTTATSYEPYVRRNSKPLTIVSSNNS